MKLGHWVLGLALGTALAAGCSASESANNGGGGGGGGQAGADASAGAAGATADAGSDAIVPDETVVIIGPGADPGSPGKFSGPDDPTAKPTLVYPDDGIVVPPNMRSLELHFKPAAGQTIFEIRFESPAIALVYYTGCTAAGTGCAFSTDDDFWTQLVEKNRGTPPVQYRIRATNATAPGAVGTSETRTLAFSKEDIIGGLYYWNTSGIVQRYDFGAPYQQAELFVSPPMAGAMFCVGCHVLSRDGAKMAIGQDMPAPAPYKVFDVATRTPIMNAGQPVGGAANFFSFAPDGKKLLFSDGVKIGLQDSTTGAIDNPSVVDQATMPDWSPDGKLMVYARPASPPPFGIGIPGVSSASLELMTHSNGTFAPSKTLVPFQGQNNYYPAFSPTKDWVVFNRSPSNQESMSNAPPSGDGELWAANVDTGTQVRLDAASNGGNCSWPKWAPDVGTYYGGTIQWLTVSSSRAYGLRLSQGAQVQLWMVGFDPAKAKAGQDPSFPAYWFPFQDMGSGNHIAQWVTIVARKPCLDESECLDGEICEDGKCYAVVK